MEWDVYDMKRSSPNKFTETAPLNSAVFLFDSKRDIKGKIIKNTGSSLEYRMRGLQSPFTNTCELKPVDILEKHISSQLSSGVIVSQKIKVKGKIPLHIHWLCFSPIYFQGCIFLSIASCLLVRVASPLRAKKNKKKTTNF